MPHLPSLQAEGSSLAGTYWFKAREDAEGIGKMLGLTGTFPVQTPEGDFWSPGKNEEELRRRVEQGIVMPSVATIPQPHLLSFREFLEK